MLINASTTQDRIARDGTTSAVLLSAELLQNAWELVLQGVHPSAIARGYRHAEEACRQHFEALCHRSQRTTRCWLPPPRRLSGKIHRPCRTISPVLPLKRQGQSLKNARRETCRRPNSSENSNANGRHHDRFVGCHRFGLGQETSFRPHAEANPIR